jgi:hypothetical protein
MKKLGTILLDILFISAISFFGYLAFAIYTDSQISTGVVVNKEYYPADNKIILADSGLKWLPYFINNEDEYVLDVQGDNKVISLYVDKDTYNSVNVNDHVNVE